ncbi:MAG: hypothetical protein JXB03_11265, partial [Spirochaetales bacterium]|nr:hypothetical protein [Spirochaetales bacterium]
RHETPFTALFLGSPLGRSRCYWPAVAGSVLVRPFAFGIKADWRGDYSVNFVPLSWFRAQRRWVKTHKALLKSRSPFLHTPVYLAWGTKDDTLDLRYTQQFYEGLFLKEESRAFDNAKHNLYIDAVRQNDVFNAALGFFDLHYPR